jgi:methionyl-tRNA synthetase
MKSTFYVTTPIYYVNDKPHIGHAYTTIAADVLARFWRLEGRDVRFLTGTDEHGIKIVKAAAEKGIEPRQMADETWVHFELLWKDLEITHDDFIRTTQPRHESRVQEIIRRLLEADEVYLGKYEGWYDEGQEEFVTESTAREQDYKSAISDRPLVRYSEENYFFRLSKWVPRLIEHIEANPDFVQPEARRNEVLSKLRQGVEDLCISRSAAKLPWGVPMPNDPGHVVYVWVDALSNYYTALGLPEAGLDDDAHAGQYWPADVHLIGKDILWFHAVYWPCILMALGVDLPVTVFAHGWWTSEGRKMSKSLGNFISREVIAELCEEYSVDVFRYFLLRAVAFGGDGDFSREMLQQRYNTDLANGVGNLLSRTLNMIQKYFDGQVPQAAEMGEAEQAVTAAAGELARQAPALVSRCQFHTLLERVLGLADATNRYIEQTAPFKLAKDPDQRDRLATILYTCAEAVRIILLYLQPVMPATARRGLEQLGWTGSGQSLSEAGRWGILTPSTAVNRGEGLFPRKQ